MTLLVESAASEAYRLSRNRMAIFWSVVFVPLLFAIGNVGYHFLTKSKAAEFTGKLDLPATMGHAPLNLAEALGRGAGLGANGAILVFTLIAAATLYAGDYRWETWRLISARNSRMNLILGKVAVFKLLALAAMLAFLVASVVGSISQAFIYERPLTFSMEVADLGSLALTWLLSWVRIVQYAMLALLTATVTRSLLAALFVPVVVGFGQAFLGGPGIALLGWSPQDWLSQLLLPGLAFDTLKAAVHEAARMPEGLVLKALSSLILWTVVPLAGAIVWFNRQDLSKE